MRRKTTIAILCIIAAFLILWDVWLYVTEPDGNTISEALLWVSRYPIVPFAFGVLCGHWFWPQRRRREDAL